MSIRWKHPLRWRGRRLGAKHLPCILGLTGTGILSLGVVPTPELLEEARKPVQIEVANDVATIQWFAHPDVFYFVEGSPDLTTWITAKLLKDTTPEGSLTLATSVANPKAFYRLDLEGDPDAARLREDSDGDGIINLLEVEAGWDAYAAAVSTDSDSDGIPDYFEQFHFGTLEHDENYVAVEGGLTMAEAFAHATDPNSNDSDGDGWTDKQELDWGWEVNYDQSRDDGSYDTYGDGDGDGVSNSSETLNGSNPNDPNDFPLGFQDSSYVLIDLGPYYWPKQVSNRGHVFLEEVNYYSHYRRWYWGDVFDFDKEVDDWEAEGLPFQPFYELNSMNNTGQIGGVYQSQPSTKSFVAAGSCGGNPAYAELSYQFRVPVIIEADGSVTVAPMPELTTNNHQDTESHEIIAMNDNGVFVVKSFGYITEMNGKPTSNARRYEVHKYVGGVYSSMESISTRAFVVISGSCDQHVDYSGEYPTGLMINNTNSIVGFGKESQDWTWSSTLNYGDNFYFSDTLNNRLDYAPVAINQNGLILGYDNGIRRIYSGSNQYALPSAVSASCLTSPENNEPLTIISNTHIAIQKRDAISGNLLPLSDGASAYFVQTAEEILHRPNQVGQSTQNEEWSNLWLTSISDNGAFIVGTANNTSTGVEHAIMLLKMDVTAHVPSELIDGDNNLQTGAEIPAVDEDTASNLQFVVNDDNDRQRAFNASSYPKDYDLPDSFSGSEDDLVAVKFEFPSDIASGTLEISANVGSANPEARAYIVTPADLAGNPIPPTKELVTLNPATSIDLSSATDTDLLWELADEGEQTLYIEGLVAKDDLEVKLSFKVNGTEVATESVHMQILPSTERTLKMLAYSGMGHRAMVHMNNSDNVLREDHDGYWEIADRVTPVAFRQEGAVSSQNVQSSWRFVDAHVLAQTGPIYNELIQQGRNIYICEDLYNAGGQSRSGQGVMLLGKPWVSGQQSGPSEGVLAHEWLHAFANVDHINITDDIMWGTSPPPADVDTNNNGILDGDETMVDSGHKGDVSQDNYNHFIN